jgi:hypothetical protein
MMDTLALRAGRGTLESMDADRNGPASWVVAAHGELGG